MWKRPQVLKLWREALGEVEGLLNREASLATRQVSIRKQAESVRAPGLTRLSSNSTTLPFHNASIRHNSSTTSLYNGISYSPQVDVYVRYKECRRKQ